MKRKTPKQVIAELRRKIKELEARLALAESMKGVTVFVPILPQDPPQPQPWAPQPWTPNYPNWSAPSSITVTC